MQTALKMLFVCACVMVVASEMERPVGLECPFTAEQESSAFRITSQKIATGGLQHQVDVVLRLNETDYGWPFAWIQSLCYVGDVEYVWSTCHIRDPKQPKLATGDGSGYEFFPELGYYKFHSKKTTWMKARAICEKERGHLVIINSEAEAAALVQMAANRQDIGYWVGIGIHNLYHDGFLTVYDEPLNSTSYTKWKVGQPENAIEQDCGGINRKGELHVISCTKVKVPFICEKELHW